MGGDFNPRSSPLMGVIAGGFIAFPKSPVTIFSMRSFVM
jgi:hypothetical protein